MATITSLGLISMRILNQPIASMYLWAIALLILLAGVSSYTLNQLPLSLILAVTVSALVEIVITKIYLKRGFKIPFSGIITGLIIGSVSPINASFSVITTAALVAILSKSFIKARGSNVFNPAALGLLVSLALFSVGDEWWAASSYNIYGLALSLTPLLIVAAYKTRRLVLSLSFVSTLIIILALRNPSNLSSLNGLDTLFFTVNFFYAFMMLPDPKTSPTKKTVQATYGISIAILYYVLAIYKTAYPLFTALLIGNIIYVLYRTRGHKPSTGALASSTI